MICRDIMSGKQIVPTKDNVVKVMWYLQACASDKVSSSAGLKYEGPQIFKMGAFSVEDNEHRLESFLNKAGAYRRKSSHLREYQQEKNISPQDLIFSVKMDIYPIIVKQYF